MLLIHHHLGLGDHFVCNGLVRYIYKNTTKDVTLAVKEHNLETIKALYSDINLKYMIVNTDFDVKHEGYFYVKIGFENCNALEWEKSFYNQIGLDYSNRYKYSFFPRSDKREKELINKLNIDGDYCFCNTSCSISNYDIKINTNYKKIYLQKITNNLLDWIGIIEKAKEIHTIDTSVFQMIKNLDIKCNKYFYPIRQENNDGTPFTFDDQNWTIYD